MLRNIVWLLGVIAAGLAVMTNVAVLAAIGDVNKELVSLETEVDRQHLQLMQLQATYDYFNAEITELQAQVKYGLGERYNIKED